MSATDIASTQSLTATQPIDFPPAGLSVTSSLDTAPPHVDPPTRVRKPKREERRPRSPRRSLTPVMVDTDPALGYHREKLQEILDTQDPVKPFQEMPKKHLLEMALFGHKLFDLGRLDEARVVFEGIVGLGPEDAFPHTMLGTIYLSQGRQEQALAQFEAALSLDPRDLAARVYRGELRLNAGKLKPATDDLFRALELGSPDDPFVERARRLIGIAQKLKHRKKR
jgi:tetratricopeptide (TPR) repeat protein